MKKIFLMCLTLAAMLYICSCAHIEEDTDETDAVTSVRVEDKAYYERFKDDNLSINVYNWGEYIPDGSEEGTINLNDEFTRLTGIHVNYSTYATNEELYAKLKGGGSSYDVIIPSDYMISRMIKEDMLEPLDMSDIPAQKNIMERFRNPEYDPNSEYSVPYTWGTIGIIYDKTAVDGTDIDWDILWDERFKDSILMFDNPRDAFAIAEITLGTSLNSENPRELKAAAEKLTEQKKLVQAYVMDEIFDKMGAGEAVLAPYYAGDALTLMNDFEHIGFVIPESGTNLFIDAMCIPRGSKNKAAAQMYISFMCEADAALAVSEHIGYSTPNQAAYEMLDDELKNDGISYPDDDFLSEKTEIYRNLSEEANLTMQTLWTEMKSSEEQTPNRVIVPVFMAMCIAASLAILIRRYLKRKKDMF